MTMRLAVLCLALVPNLAVAAPARPVVADQDADAAAARPTLGATKNFIYDDEDIQGESLQPDHEPIPGRRPGNHPSLITLRTHFIPQMLRMANDV